MANPEDHTLTMTSAEESDVVPFAPLHKRLRAAMDAAGLRGHVATGFNAESQHVWARWDSPDGLHLLARAEKEKFDGREAAYVASFVRYCLGDGPAPRMLNGLMPAVRWTV